MTQEVKQLLLKDLCARLPYGVRCHYADKEEHTDMRLHRGNFHDIAIECIRPYLRPLSSMTEEEKDEYDKLVMCNASWVVDDWLNKRHFDYRGLIPMDLALEAPKDMYN